MDGKREEWTAKKKKKSGGHGGRKGMCRVKL
jgi:hypothetical protein